MNSDKLFEIKYLAAEIVNSGKKYFVIHYTAVNADVTAEQVKDYDIKAGNGVPYHLFLNSDGSFERLTKFSAEVGGMYYGYGKNDEWCKNSFQICFETIDNLKFNALQEEILIEVVKQVVKLNPKILVGGHREFPDLTNRVNGRQATLCPGVAIPDVSGWLMANGIPKENCFFEVHKW